MRRTQDNKILLKTMEQMPDVFTSNQFNLQAISNGYSALAIAKRSGTGDFIRKYATNDYPYSKMWTKKNISKNKVEKIERIDNIENAIKLLKSKGYKVLKPINEWQEV